MDANSTNLRITHGFLSDFINPMLLKTDKCKSSYNDAHQCRE